MYYQRGTSRSLIEQVTIIVLILNINLIYNEIKTQPRLVSFSCTYLLRFCYSYGFLLIALSFAAEKEKEKIVKVVTNDDDCYKFC